MGFPRRRRLVTLLDVGVIASGVVPPPGPAGIPSGLGVWYQADQEVAAAGDGSPVTAWGDSGIGAHDLAAVAPPTLKTNERNGLPVIRFDGVDDKMQTASILGSVLAGATAQTVFLVQKQTSSTATSATYSWDSSGTSANEMSAHLRYSSGDLYHITGSAVSGTGFTQVSPSPEPWLGTWHIVEMVRNASASEIVIEGNPATVFLQPTTGLNVAASSVLVVGARVANSPPHNFFGDISELIIYNRILSAPERDSVRNYLKTKWGIAQNKLLLNPAKTGYLLLSPSRNDRLALN